MSPTKSTSPPLGLPDPRKEVENLKAYSAPLEGRRDLLRLDFNENTIGPSPLVIQSLTEISANEISIYPEYQGLREAFISNLKALNSGLNLNPHQIGLFNGVDAAIHAIFHAYGDKGDQLLTTIPTFGYYSPCALMQGMQIIEIPYEKPNFKFPLSAITKQLEKSHPKILLICNPNNPTGTRVSPEAIVHIADSFQRTLVVVDELYEAFTGDSVIPVANFNSTPNLVVLRSLSKTAGLAGLRIGFAIGNEQVINTIERLTGPYDINSLAVKAAFVALTDQNYIDNYVKEVLKAKSWIENQLRISKLKYQIDGGNFFLIWTKNKPSQIDNLLKSKGILILSMEGKKFIEDTIRVSIGTIKQMQKFWQVYQEIENI